MNIVLLFDGIATDVYATADARGVLESVDAVEQTLCDGGHDCTRVEVFAGLAWVDAMRSASPDLVFNLCEGVGGDASFEASVASALSLSGVPFTGATAECLALAHRKDATNAVLTTVSLSVPRSWPIWHHTVEPLHRREDALDIQLQSMIAQIRNYPVIVKPSAEDASVGISQRSVARDAAELAVAVEAAADHGALIVQELLTGNELTVGIVGDTLLPVAEIVFTGGDSLWPIVDYASKWSPGSAEDHAATAVCPAECAVELTFGARALALTAWQAVGGRGYGRIDLRADSAGLLHVLDINPNPDLSPNAGLARMARAHGWSYAELVRRIMDEAL